MIDHTAFVGLTPEALIRFRVGLEKVHPDDPHPARFFDQLRDLLVWEPSRRQHEVLGPEPKVDLADCPDDRVDVLIRWTLQLRDNFALGSPDLAEVANNLLIALADERTEREQRRKQLGPGPT